MPCPKCPHNVVEIAAADFTVGRLIGDALLKLGHRIERETITLTMKEFQEIVLAKATSAPDASIEPEKTVAVPADGAKTEVETRTTVQTVTTVTEPSGVQTTTASPPTQNSGPRN